MHNRPVYSVAEAQSNAGERFSPLIKSSAALHWSPDNRPKVTIYKRFTDRRRSDLEQEQKMAAANASGGRDGRPALESGQRRSLSVPVASRRCVAQSFNVCPASAPRLYLRPCFSRFLELKQNCR